MLELVFTSAKNGLIPGRSGFCSVAWTQGMPQNLVVLLENLSGYNLLYPANDPRAAENPVCYSYQKVRLGTRSLYIMSRIAFAGLDYTGRTNKIAHHIIIENEAELSNLQYGPVSALLCDENFFTSWDGEPRLLPRRHHLKSAVTEGFKAQNWEFFSGHAEWAGHAANTFYNDENSCIYCEYDNEMHGKNMLQLVAEVVRLLPKEMYNAFTFNTYFSAPTNDINCFFRAALPNCQILSSIKRFKPETLISLIEKTPLIANMEYTPFVQTAVSGQQQITIVPENTNSVVIEPVPYKTDEEIPLNLAAQSVKTEKFSATQHKIAKNNTIEEFSPRTRMIIFTSCAAALLIIIGLAIFIIMKAASDTAPKQISAPPAKTSVQQIDDIQPAPQQEISKPVPTKSEKPPKTSAVPEKTVDVSPEKITPEKPAAKKPAKPPVRKTPKAVVSAKLSSHDSFFIFKSFCTNAKYIQLPYSISRADKIEVTLNNKWGEQQLSDIKQFIDVKDRSTGELVIYSYNVNSPTLAPDKDNPNTMSLKLEKGNLVIIGGKQDDYSPRREYIKTITFYVRNQKFIWHNRWNDDFFKNIPYGKINNNFTYEKSDEELQFTNSDIITISNTSFTDLKTAILFRNSKLKDHHDKLKEYKLEKEKSAPGTFEDFIKKYKSVRVALEKPYDEIDYAKIKKDYDFLNSKYFKLNENAVHKYDYARTKRYKEHIQKFRTSQHISNAKTLQAWRIDLNNKIGKMESDRKNFAEEIKKNKKLLTEVDYCIFMDSTIASLKKTRKVDEKFFFFLYELNFLYNLKFRAYIQQFESAKEKNKLNALKVDKFDYEKELIKFRRKNNSRKNNSKNASSSDDNAPESIDKVPGKKELKEKLTKYNLPAKWLEAADKNVIFTEQMLDDLKNELVTKIIRKAKGAI